MERSETEKTEIGKRRAARRERPGREGVAEKWKTGGVIAALVSAVAVFAVMLQLEKNMLTRYERGSVYVAAEMIPRGQRITAENAHIYLQEKSLEKSCIPAGALRSREQAEEQAAVFDIEPGLILAESMFESLEDILRGMKEPVVAGFKAEDLYQVAGGVLRAGDRIHIYSVSEEGEATPVWANVYVREVFDATGAKIKAGDILTAAQRINIYLDKKDVEAFYSELARGNLRVVMALR